MGSVRSNTRVLDESSIRRRMNDKVESVLKIMQKREGEEQRIEARKAAEIGKILESVVRMTSEMDDEWSIFRSDEEQKTFLDKKVHEQLAFCELRSLMQSVADLVRCKQQMYHADKGRQWMVKSVSLLPKEPSQLIRVSRFEIPTPAQNNHEIEMHPQQALPFNPRDEGRIKEEPVEETCEIKKEHIEEAEQPLFSTAKTSEIKEEPVEIKDEPLDDFVQNTPNLFECLANLPVDEMPLAGEPDDAAFGYASSSSWSHNQVKTSKEGATKRRRGETCRFCKLHTENFFTVPTDPQERREFLINNLICNTQAERNEREVLLISSKVVHFCKNHIIVNDANMTGSANMVNGKRMKPDSQIIVETTLSTGHGTQHRVRKIVDKDDQKSAKRETTKAKRGRI